MDIVDLGLVYDVEIEPDKVKVIHTLTSMGCPAGPMIQEDIHTTVAETLSRREGRRARAHWDPPWTPDKMSDDAKFILSASGLGRGPGASRPPRLPHASSTGPP